MTQDEIVAALRKLRVETGSLICLGCGWEHRCGAPYGCRIMREAADLLEKYQAQAFTLQQELEWKRAQLDCANTAAGILKRQNAELQAAVAAVSHPTKTLPDCRWINVEDRLPADWRESDGDMVNFLGYMPEFGVDIVNYAKPANAWVCLGIPAHVTHWMPLPPEPEEVRVT